MGLSVPCCQAIILVGLFIVVVSICWSLSGFTHVYCLNFLLVSNAPLQKRLKSYVYIAQIYFEKIMLGLTGQYFSSWNAGYNDAQVSLSDILPTA